MVVICAESTYQNSYFSGGRYVGTLRTTNFTGLKSQVPCDTSCIRFGGRCFHYLPPKRLKLSMTTAVAMVAMVIAARINRGGGTYS